MNTQTLDRPLPDYLPEVADAIHGQMIELHKRPCPAAAERLAYNLDGARRMVLQVRAEMMEAA